VATICELDLAGIYFSGNLIGPIEPRFLQFDLDTSE
jgi:hypothetical protein